MKKIVRSNYRVEVFPTRSYYIGVDDENCQHLSADELAKEVRRHVDHEGVRVIHDAEAVCTHCGHRWTEDRDDYNGGCCDKDEGAEEARLAAAEALAIG